MNKNAREKELLEEAYASLYEAKDESAESIESIEDRFASAVEYAGDVGEFNVQDFLEFKPYIANWDTLLEIIDEENTEGFSERWEEIKFGRSEEDNEGMSNLEALISSSANEDGEIDIKQGGGTSPAAFDAEEKTDYA